jgi:hypothetical protein
MKRNLLIILLVIFSLASGVLMSHSRWIAKVGITFLHKGYSFTKVWWQGAIAVFLLYIILLSIHGFVQRRMAPNVARSTHFVMLLAAMAGLYFSVQDFKHDISHHLLGWRFHMGVYLFWGGWMIMAMYFLSATAGFKERDKKGTANS